MTWIPVSVVENLYQSPVLRTELDGVAFAKLHSMPIKAQETRIRDFIMVGFMVHGA